ncbi:hypothetical protein PFISCL1PPCAC_6920, partial [Pristionchus fissidentatus]
ASCKARWRPFWTCRNSHSTIEPKGIRYIQFEFPEPALDHLQLNLVAGEHEVKILLERMPGTENFLWRDTADLRRILLSREEANRKMNEISDLSTCREEMETAYSPTEFSYSEKSNGISEEKDRSFESSDPINNQSKNPRSTWSQPRRNWSDNVNSLRIPEKLSSVILDREPEVLATTISPALEESLKATLCSCQGSKRGALFAMVHSVVVESLQQGGVERAAEVWKEIERSYGTTPFVDNVL